MEELHDAYTQYANVNIKINFIFSFYKYNKIKLKFLNFIENFVEQNKIRN